MRNLIFVILFCVSSFWLFGQNKAIVSFSSDSITMGDQFTMYINLVLEEGVEMQKFDLSFIKFEKIGEQRTLSLDDKIYGDFELLNSKSWQDVNGSGIIEKQEILWTPKVTGKGLAYQNEIILKSWDFGNFIVPSMQFQLSNGDVLYSREVPFVVQAKFLDPSLLDSVGMAPLKPIIPENYLFGDYLRTLLPIAIPILALILFWVFIQRTKLRKAKKKQALEEPEIIRPAHEIALRRLNELASKELWQKGEIKAYQSEITHIIREYLENRYGILALESTTSEIAQQLKPLGFNPALKSKLKDILQMADLVKFAKAKPPEDIHAQFMNDAYDFVDQTKQLESLEKSSETNSDEEE